MYQHLKQAYALHRMIYNARHEPIDYEYIDINPAFEQMLGWSREKVIGTRISQLMPSGHQYWVQRFNRAIETGVPEFFTQYSQALNRYYEIYTISPEPEHFIAIFTDITERVAQHAQLFSERELFATITQTSQLGIIIADIQGKIIFFNDTAKNIFQFAEDKQTSINLRIRDDRFIDYSGNPLSEADHPFKKVLKSKTPLFDMKIAIKRANGEIRYLTVNGGPIFDDLGEISQVLLNIRDLTEEFLQSQHLLAAEESLDVLQKIIDSAEIEVFWTDCEGRFLFANNYACRWLEYTPEEMMRMSIWDIDVEFPRDHWQDNWQKMRELKIVTLESRHRTKSGKIFPVIIHQNFLIHKGKEMNFAIVRDISDIKNAEEKVRQSQKLEAIGQLAGGIAHDFNNLLAGIIGNAQLIQLDDHATPEIREAAQEILSTGDRAAHLIRQLLGIARRGKAQVVPIDIHISIEELKSIVEKTFLKNIRLKTHFTATNSVIKGDPNQILQILLNLSVNARDAMPDGGTITIETENLLIGHSDGDIYPELSPNLYLLLRISDTGIGIPPENMPHMFEPFFTTKPMGQGTGLGLATVWGIVHNHEGIIKVESRVNSGTTFTVIFPTTPEPLPHCQESSNPEVIYGSGTVLLVDDEQYIRSVGSQILQKLGYTPITAASGTEALDIYRNQHPEIKAIILDMIMPEMDGKTTFYRLREINPDAQVIIASGYSLDSQLQELTTQGICQFIQKPYRIDQLSQKIADCTKKANS
jgi:PAS domain S-box-containing protein